MPEYTIQQMEVKFGTAYFYIELPEGIDPQTRNATYALVNRAEEDCNLLGA